jgi:hypothetical protein
VTIAADELVAGHVINGYLLLAGTMLRKRVLRLVDPVFGGSNTINFFSGS